VSHEFPSNAQSFASETNRSSWRAMTPNDPKLSHERQQPYKLEMD
jgi:hypothetical protein